MNEVWDIYDRQTFRLVKPDVTLTTKHTHKDLTNDRYLKLRVGNNVPEYDMEEFIAYVRTLEQLVWQLRSDVNRLDRY